MPSPVAAVLAASAIADVLMFLYNSTKERPDLKMAQHLQALQIEDAMKAGRIQAGEEETFNQFREYNAGAAQAVMSAGRNLRSTPLYGAGGQNLLDSVAAQVGMDPDELAGRYDQSRANIYTPRYRRGLGMDALAARMRKGPAPVSPVEEGPAQMGPGGFS